MMETANTYKDAQGIVWQKFIMEYRHEVDGMTFTIDLWAVDFADAAERLEFIKQNGKIIGRVTT